MRHSKQKMNTLPSCSVLQFPIRAFSVVSDEDYSKLLTLIQEYVGADCWAFTINNEILFNSYNNETKTFKQVLEEKIIRDKIIESAHSILCEVNRRNVDTRIDIYMFSKPESYNLMIRYVADEQKYIVHRLNSQEYIDKYGEDNEI